MSNYSLNAKLPSCDVPRQLLVDLEEYLRLQCDERVADAKATRHFGVTVKDSVGEEHTDCVENFSFRLFPDDTREITLVRSADAKGVGVAVTVAFGLDDFSAKKIDVRCHGTNAREIAHGILNGILKRIEPYRNSHTMYQGGIGFFVMLVGWGLTAGSLITSISADSTPRQRVVGGKVGWTLAIAMASFTILRRMCPYAVFETRLNERRTNLVKLVWGGFVMSLLASVAYGFIRGS